VLDLFAEGNARAISCLAVGKFEKIFDLESA
jgi:hypothetical protein